MSSLLDAAPGLYLVLLLAPGLGLDVPLHLDVLALGVLGTDVLVLDGAIGLGLVLLAAAALVLDDALFLDAVLGLGLVLLLLAVLDADVLLDAALCLS